MEVVNSAFNKICNSYRIFTVEKSFCLEILELLTPRRLGGLLFLGIKRLILEFSEMQKSASEFSHGLEIKPIVLLFVQDSTRYFFNRIIRDLTTTKKPQEMTLCRP